MKTFDLRPTSDPNLFRVVDRDGEWERYAAAIEWRQIDGKAEVTRFAFLRGVTAILHRAWGKPALMNYLRNQSPEAIEKKFHYAGEKGDAVHQFIARVLSGEPFNLSTVVRSEDRITDRQLKYPEWDCVLSMSRFWAMHEPKLIAHELSVANLTKGYAGSLDAIVRLTKSCGLGPKKGCDCEKFIGRLLLLDWKSGAGIWPDMGAQVAAYANADLSKILHGNRLGGTAIVRLGTKHRNGFEGKFFNVEKTRKNWKRFQSAINIDDADYKPFDPDCIFDIPESVSLTVEREELEPKLQEVA
jgi:hypothetical protein